METRKIYRWIEWGVDCADAFFLTKVEIKQEWKKVFDHEEWHKLHECNGKCNETAIDSLFEKGQIKIIELTSIVKSEIIFYSDGAIHLQMWMTDTDSVILDRLFDTKEEAERMVDIMERAISVLISNGSYKI